MPVRIGQPYSQCPVLDVPDGIIGWFIDYDIVVCLCLHLAGRGCGGSVSMQEPWTNVPFKDRGRRDTGTGKPDERRKECQAECRKLEGRSGKKHGEKNDCEVHNERYNNAEKE